MSGWVRPPPLIHSHSPSHSQSVSQSVSDCTTHPRTHPPTHSEREPTHRVSCAAHSHSQSLTAAHTHSHSWVVLYVVGCSLTQLHSSLTVTVHTASSIKFELFDCDTTTPRHHRDRCCWDTAKNVGDFWTATDHSRTYSTTDLWW